MTVAWLQSLVGELRSLRPRSQLINPPDKDKVPPTSIPFLLQPRTLTFASCFTWIVTVVLGLRLRALKSLPLGTHVLALSPVS